MLKQFEAIAPRNGEGRARKPAGQRAQQKTAPKLTRADVIAAENFIRHYACDGVSVEQLVRETQRVPAAVFNKYFKQTTGRTLQEAMRDCQLARARHLLAHTELSPAFIAEHCGFAGVAALKRALKAADGHIPRQLQAVRRRSCIAGQIV